MSKSVTVSALNRASGRKISVSFVRATPRYFVDAQGRRWYRDLGVPTPKSGKTFLMLPREAHEVLTATFPDPSTLEMAS
jgi:hypothetical protein